MEGTRKTTVEEFLSLDVRKLNIVPGQAQLEGVAQLVWTPCNFGGSRPWFVCPGQGCGRRAAILYLLEEDDSFLCRLCLDLPYKSQGEDPIGRARRRVEKARARLGPGGSRPKGMHRITFLAAIREYQEAVEELECLALAAQAQSRARQLIRRRRWRKRSSRNRRLGL